MLDTALATRIRTAAHTQNRKLAEMQVLIYDWRIHNWNEAHQDSVQDYADLAVAACADGTVVRARTLTNNTLDVRVATPGATITWSANTLTQNSPFGFGVALYVNGQTVDVFWVDAADSMTIKTRRGTVGGGTIGWGTAATVATASTQASGARIFLTAPDVDLLFFTDTPNSYATNIKVALKSSGTWTVSAWDFAPMDLGASGLEIYGITVSASGITALKLATGDFNLIFYARQPNGMSANGLWQVRVSNLIAGQTAHWQHIYPLFSNTPTATDPVTNTQVSRLYIGFPKVQRVGNEWWITALEVSAFAGHAIIHLAYQRSSNGRDWVDRQYLAGIDYFFWRANSQIQFWINHLYDTQIVVGGNYIYLFAYDAAYRTDATILCGVDNPAKRIDVTGDVKGWDYDRVADGQTGQGSLEIANPLAYDTSILRAGSRILIRAGYVTTQGEEILDVWTGSIDEIQEPYSVAQGVHVTISFRDMTKLLTEDYWTADVFYSFYGPEIVNLPTITSLNSFYIPNGSFSESGGIMYGGLVVDDLPNIDNLATLVTMPARDGFLELKIECRNSWTNAYAGIVFQLQDDQNYYVVIADGATVKLYQATAAANVNALKNVVYTQLGSSATAVLGTNTVYYLRAHVWHGTLDVRYSSDLQNWTKCNLGSYGTLATNAANWGLVQKGNISISPAYGETRLVTNDIDHWYFLNDPNPANPVIKGAYVQYLARVRIQKGGDLRALAIQFGRWGGSDPGYIPSMTVQVVNDVGNGSFPASLSDPTNILWETQVDSTSTPVQYAITPPTKIVATGTPVLLLSESYVWVYIKSNGRITPTASGLQATPIALGYIPLAGAPGVGDPYRCFMNYRETLTQGDFNLLASSLCVALYTAYDSSGVEIQGVLYSSGETYKTIEDVATGIVAKAGQLQVTPDSAFVDDFNSGLDKWDTANAIGAWSAATNRLAGYHASSSAWAFLLARNTSFGDVLLRSVMQIKVAAKSAGILLRATGAPSSFTQAYLLYLTTSASDNGTLALAKIVNGTITRIANVPCMTQVPIGVDFRVTFVQHVGMFAAHINDCLAAMVTDNQITAAGAIGLAVYGNNAGGVAAEWDNVRVPDIDNPVPSFSVEIGETGGSALKRLVGDNRVDWFSRADGSLRIGSFAMPASLDTYDSTMLSGEWTQNDREWFNHVRPTGKNVDNADRWDAELLEAQAFRKFRIHNFADAASSEEAWNAASEPIKRGKELTRTGSFDHPAVLVNEPRDRISIAEPLTNVDDDFVIDSIHVRCEVNKNEIKLTETVNVRVFVA